MKIKIGIVVLLLNEFNKICHYSGILEKPVNMIQYTWKSTWWRKVNYLLPRPREMKEMSQNHQQTGHENLEEMIIFILSIWEQFDKTSLEHSTSGWLDLDWCIKIFVKHCILHFCKNFVQTLNYILSQHIIQMYNNYYLQSSTFLKL